MESSLAGGIEIPRLDRLHRELPELKLQITASESELTPRRHDVSSILTFFAPPWPADVEAIELATESICAVMGPQLAVQIDPELPETLFSTKLLYTASRPQAWPQWSSAHTLDRARLDRALGEGQGFDHLYYLIEAAVAGMGVAIAPRLLVEDDLHSGRLIAPWGFIETSARLCLWLPRHAAHRHSVRLAEWLKRELDDMPLPK